MFLEHEWNPTVKCLVQTAGRCIPHMQWFQQWKCGKGDIAWTLLDFNKRSKVRLVALQNTLEQLYDGVDLYAYAWALFTVVVWTDSSFMSHWRDIVGAVLTQNQPLLRGFSAHWWRFRRASPKKIRKWYTTHQGSWVRFTRCNAFEGVTETESRN